MDKIKKHKDKILVTLLVVSFSWAILSAFMFFSDYERLHRGGFLPGPHSWGPQTRNHVPSEKDVERLKPWVTFAFVNKVFKLPPEFLKEALHITDTKYPNLTVEAVAKSQHVDSAILLQTLKTTLSARMLLSATTTIQ